MVHITNIDGGERRQLDLCENCADAYYKSTPRMNAFRGLICLSDSYREDLYKRLEQSHPEVFEPSSNSESILVARDTMRHFLQRTLQEDKIEVNNDGLEMLLVDLAMSDHFNARQHQFRIRQKK